MSQPLTEDLDELVRRNIITTDTARQIEEYYSHKKTNSSHSFTIVLGLLGSLLIGLGIILVVAHNWEMLGRGLQTFFAFLPLALGQGLCLYTLLRKPQAKGWRESSTVFLFFAIASCIALISQIYQVSGDLSAFLLTWMLLSLPMVYVMGSSFLSLLIIAGITWYACLIGYSGTSSSGIHFPYMYLIVLILIIPYYYQLAVKNRAGNFYILHNWFLVLSIVVSLGTFTGRHFDYFQWIFIGYLALFGIFYLIGKTRYFMNERMFANPFLLIGSTGIIVIFLCWSFDWLWRENNHSANSSIDFFQYLFSWIVIILLTICAYLFIKTTRQQQNKQVDLLGISPLLFTIVVLAFPQSGFFGPLAINIWIVFVGLQYVRKGIAQNHLGILNFGLLIIASLAILRFFDDSIPFIWRGLFFITAGSGFFIANYVILKKRKALSKTTNV